MIESTNNFFSKKTPSIFIINSPLHVLCVMEAINEFSLEDYSIIFLTKKNEIRNSQTISMLNYFNLKYKRFDLCFAFNFLSFIRLFLGNSKKYSRVFVPCGLGAMVYIVCLNYLKKAGHLVYIDDGIATIAILKDEKRSFVNKRAYIMYKLVKYIFKTKKIEIDKYFYTLYSDISTLKIVYPNSFTNLSKCLGEKQIHSNDIYFIGTVVDRVCKLNSIPLDLFKEILGNLMDDAIKQNPDKKVFYIPHGRDRSSFIVDFCRLHNVEYHPLDEAIELYFVKNHIRPLSVYGYVSTALLNIKKIMPDVNVINWYLASKKSVLYENRHNVSVYYATHGIEYRFFDVDKLKS